MTSQQINKLLSKYRECRYCKHKFMLSMTVLTHESRNNNYMIFCPNCNSNNIAIINRNQYYKNYGGIL
jgi:Zn finger protein HypA/HybF involved in hydrogenase expression